MSVAKSLHGVQVLVGVSRSQLRWLFAAIWAANVGLLASNFLFAAGWAPHPSVVNQLNMDEETAFGAWYPSALLILLALSAALHYLMDRHAKHEPPSASVGWLHLAGIALILSADEICGLHERADRYYRNEVSTQFLGLGVSWTLLFLPLIVLCVVALVRLVSHSLKRYPVARRLALAGLCCWVGAVALEMVQWGFLDGELAPLIGVYEPALEEGLELVGTTLLLHAVFASMSSRSTHWRQVLLGAPPSRAS